MARNSVCLRLVFYYVLLREALRPYNARHSTDRMIVNEERSKNIPSSQGSLTQIYLMFICAIK